ncbi:AraC family transcriptional regulator [Neobacillus niacini]
MTVFAIKGAIFVIIVEQVGYDNISYFYRIFKEKYGQTPK